MALQLLRWTAVAAFSVALMACSSSNTPPVEAASPAGSRPTTFADLQENVHFVTLPEQRYWRGNRFSLKVEVAEVFGYSCVHCAALDPVIQRWSETREDIRFEHVPAAFGGTWDNFARVYFAAETLNIEKELHPRLFDALHGQRPYQLRAPSPENIALMVSSLDVGTNQNAFLSAMNNDTVNRQMAQASAWVNFHRLQGTPAIIIDGRYRVLNQASGWDDTVHVTNLLVDRVKHEREQRTSGGPSTISDNSN